MTVAERERQVAYDVVTRNDPRFDGQFYSAVLTTGIFCRPGCPGRPRAENVRFFATAAAAAEAGFRPCLRCHPESAPDAPEWRIASPVVNRALRLIGGGALDNGGVNQMAARLNVSARQLQRLFVEELGVPPVAVAQTRRLLFAKKLIDETDLSMTDIAFSAGYSSVRRFNEAIQQTYGRAPSDLRRRRAAAGPNAGTVELKLFYREPYNWPAMLAFLAEHGAPMAETTDGKAYRRTIRVVDLAGTITVLPLAGQRALLLRVPANLSRYLLPITERVKQIFDLKADPVAIDEDLARDPSLAPMIGAHAGMRLPGCWDGFEVALQTLLEAHAPGRSRELLKLLVEAFGEPLPDSSDPSLTRLFPTPDRLCAAALDQAGTDEVLATSIRSLACAVRDGRINLDSTASLDEMTGQLANIPGFDPEAIAYVAMRVLAEPDVDLAGNRFLAASQSSSSGAPWRSYVAMYRWAASRTGSLTVV